MKLPPYIAAIYHRGWGKANNQYVQGDFEPGTSSFVLAPTTGNQIWLVYGRQYGEVDPAGPTDKVKFRWIHPDVENYSDTLKHSTLDYPYPSLMLITEGRRLKVEVTNDTDSTQTIDFLLFVAQFNRMADYAMWRRWFDRRYGLAEREEKPREEKISELEGKVEALEKILEKKDWREGGE